MSIFPVGGTEELFFIQKFLILHTVRPHLTGIAA